MPDQPEFSKSAPKPEPLAPVAPMVLAVVVVLVLIVVGAYVALELGGADPGGFVLLVGAPVLTGIVGTLLARQVHAVEQRARIIQEQTNGALSAQIDAVHNHIDEEARTLRWLALRGAQGAPGSPLPAQRDQSVPSSSPGRLPPTSSGRADHRR